MRDNQANELDKMRLILHSYKQAWNWAIELRQPDNAKLAQTKAIKAIEALIVKAKVEELEWFKELATLKLFKDVGSEYHINTRHIEYRIKQLKSKGSDDE